MGSLLREPELPVSGGGDTAFANTYLAYEFLSFALKTFLERLTAVHDGALLVEQHRWYCSVLRGHYGYYGMPHNWRSLNGFLQDVRRIWFNCLRRRSQKNRRMGWDWFEDVTARLPLPQPRITHPWTPRTA